MQRLFIFFQIALRRTGAMALALLFSVQIGAQELYVGSYNIRYKNGDDAANGNSWEQRCPVLCDQVNFEHPDVFGAQEVLESQLKDMLLRLDGYDYIGVGRDDGKTKGEYAAIFYDKQKLRLVDSGHFWLSETPDKPSLGWDAACIRICTWGLFSVNVNANLNENENGRSTSGRLLPKGRKNEKSLQFYFFNLHMDHVGVVARREAAKLVVERIRQMAGDSVPVVLTGDFNVVAGISRSSGSTWIRSRAEPSIAIDFFTFLDCCEESLTATALRSLAFVKISAILADTKFVFHVWQMYSTSSLPQFTINRFAP